MIARVLQKLHSGAQLPTICGQKQCRPLRRSYTGEVRGDERQWLADRLAAECERQEGRTDSTDRRSASLQLRRRVAAYQVLDSHHAACLDW